jgi:hypothetical protein
MITYVWRQKWWDLFPLFLDIRLLTTILTFSSRDSPFFQNLETSFLSSSSWRWWDLAPASTTHRKYSSEQYYPSSKCENWSWTNSRSTYCFHLRTVGKKQREWQLWLFKQFILLKRNRFPIDFNISFIIRASSHSLFEPCMPSNKSIGFKNIFVRKSWKFRKRRIIGPLRWIIHSDQQKTQIGSQILTSRILGHW